MTNPKNKTMNDLEHALQDLGMSSEAVKQSLEMVMKVVSTKYMTELYAALPHEVIEQVQTMSQSGATKLIHEVYLEKMGIAAVDRLDEIIHLTIVDMVDRPGDFFQKKSA